MATWLRCHCIFSDDRVFMTRMREGDDGLVPQARPAQGDHTTGLAFVAGILAALRQVERTGASQAIETSLYETAVWTQASDYATTAIDSAPVRRRARENMLTPTANRYPCGDGQMGGF